MQVMQHEAIAAAAGREAYPQSSAARRLVDLSPAARIHAFSHNAIEERAVARVLGVCDTTSCPTPRLPTGQRPSNQHRGRRHLGARPMGAADDWWPPLRGKGAQTNEPQSLTLPPPAEAKRKPGARSSRSLGLVTSPRQVLCSPIEEHRVQRVLAPGLPKPAMTRSTSAESSRRNLWSSHDQLPMDHDRTASQGWSVAWASQNALPLRYRFPRGLPGVNATSSSDNAGDSCESGGLGATAVAMKFEAGIATSAVRLPPVGKKSLPLRFAAPECGVLKKGGRRGRSSDCGTR